MPGDRFAIQLDRQRWLRFDLNALASIEEQTGQTLGTKLDIGAKNLRAILWAGLVHEDSTLTIERVGSLVTGENYQAIAGTIAEALAAAFGKPKAPADPQPADGIGTTLPALATVPSI